MVQTLLTVLPYGVLVSHAVLVIVFVATIFRRSWGSSLFAFIGRNTLVLGFLVSLAAIAGSLFYSEIVGYPPCVLCWWQRVFLYPQVILLGMALWKGDRGVFSYSSVMASLAGVVALYHSYVYWGGESLLPCTALGGACEKVYVMEFGYITIPSMSLTIVLFLLLLSWINRLYRNENRNA